ncbi:TcpQ domain-containing protein [Citrobacter rodentium]|uniref:Type IV pilus biogenesis protein n=3 Tax=Citrobacter rodentium TaxID=67825 RepID=D2TPB0_CITRI|nr:TcpQ domain-containing protein [Citrobacter rodentium]AAO17807.1 CfcC [Citrobacter rodentium]CBG91343.1 putative Type IV pilus biogenesis protein [Citrobacter rodentium ICC168]
MIIRKNCLFLLSVMFLPQVQANNNNASDIHTVASSEVSGATNHQSARNPFTGETQSMLSSATPSLIILENSLLSQEIGKWVSGNGYKLFWNSKKDYRVYNSITLSGKNDDEILQALGELFFSENYGLVVKKYQKNRVIVIDEM